MICSNILGISLVYGANTQRIVRKEIMEDWAIRWAWLKEYHDSK